MSQNINNVLEFHRKAAKLQIDYLHQELSEEEALKAIKDLYYENYKETVPIEELNFYTNGNNKRSNIKGKK